MDRPQLASYVESLPPADSYRGGFMHIDQEQVSLFERWAVVAIFLLVAAFAIRNVWHEVKTSEERILNNAVGEYETLMKMYPEKFQTLPQMTVRMQVAGA